MFSSFSGFPIGLMFQYPLRIPECYAQDYLLNSALLSSIFRLIFFIIDVFENTSNEECVKLIS